MFGGRRQRQRRLVLRLERHRVDASYGHDIAAGTLHMEATLEPRSDVAAAASRSSCRRARGMQLQVGAKEPMHEADDATKPVIGQKVKLTAIAAEDRGSPMETDKPLSLNISDPSLNYTAHGKTDDNGEMTDRDQAQGATRPRDAGAGDGPRVLRPGQPDRRHRALTRWEPLGVRTGSRTASAGGSSRRASRSRARARAHGGRAGDRHQGLGDVFAEINRRRARAACRAS